MEFHIPETHPRYYSLVTREKLVKGFLDGYVVPQGLIAHGRGEAFDYLIGEVTIEPAIKAMKAAIATMLLAKYPVISVNGNVVALVGKEIIELAREINAKIEINLFYRTRERIEKIKKVLKELGLSEILPIDENDECIIPELFSERRRVSCQGIYIADVVMVPLEDGDRTEALKKMGKKVIAIDLNPLSRTAQMADITIVDNIVRAIPKMIEITKELRKLSRKELEEIVKTYNNKEILSECIQHIVSRLQEIAKKGKYIEF